MGRLFKQGLSIVEQNRVLSRFQFDQRFYLKWPMIIAST